MRYSRNLLIGAGILLVSSAALLGQRSTQTGNGGDATGKYQLFQGEYLFVNAKGQEFWLKGLFRINTSTGAVWLGESNQIADAQGQVVQKTWWRPFEGSLTVPPPK